MLASGIQLRASLTDSGGKVAAGGPVTGGTSLTITFDETADLRQRRSLADYRGRSLTTQPSPA